MAPERVVLCGGASGRGLPARPDPLVLDLFGAQANVNLRLQDVCRGMWTGIPPVLRDLMDVAAYVYAADQATPRANGGRVDGPEIGAGWRRRFRFHIPVRRPDVWNADTVRGPLVSVLSFLSEDEYEFDFTQLKKDTSLDGFIDFSTTPFSGEVDEVVMFSGGLDSLAGAITEIGHGRRVLLVNHRSTGKMAPRHGQLVRALARHGGDHAPVHFPVWVNKKKALAREHTQRTRSFLFAALGGMFAHMIGRPWLRFYENGVTSLNLPPSAQVVGARASRTTHPRVLAGFGTLLTALFGKPFTVENPFQWDTKAGVVKRIADAGCSNVIGLLTSCGHTLPLASRTYTHCGVCSQCIDRRFAVLAAGQGEHDSAGGYAVDLLTGARKDGEDKMMLAGYLDLADRVEGMDAAGFYQQFGEVYRALPHLGLSVEAAGVQVFEMYRKHAQQVTRVIEDAIAADPRAIRKRTLPPSCLLRLAYDDGTPGDAPAAEPHRPEGNYFVRRGSHWAIRFGSGDEKIYNPDIGFQYLHILLASPERDYSASDLAVRVDRSRRDSCSARTASGCSAEELSVTPSLGGDDTLDPEAVHDYQVRLAEIDEGIQQAEASDAPNRLEVIDELEAQKQQLTAELRKSKGLKGRPRKLGGDDRNRVRNRVCNPVRRALQQIAVYDPPLHACLKRDLRLGYHLCYAPRDGVTWTTDS